MNFAHLEVNNAARAKKWHDGTDPWSLNDWAVGFGGEAGEVLNECKKIRRLIGGIKAKQNPASLEEAFVKLRKEIDDALIYLDLLAQEAAQVAYDKGLGEPEPNEYGDQVRLDMSLQKCVVVAFNKVSEREGFPEQLDIMQND